MIEDGDHVDAMKLNAPFTSENYFKLNKMIDNEFFKLFKIVEEIINLAKD